MQQHSDGYPLKSLLMRNIHAHLHIHLIVVPRKQQYIKAAGHNVTIQCHPHAESHFLDRC